MLKSGGVIKKKKQNKARQSLLALTGWKGWMRATIPDTGHFELSWEQTIILSPPIIQMIAIIMIIRKILAEILMVFTIS